MIRVVVDRETCIGVALCRAEAPGSFVLVDGRSQALDPVHDPLESLFQAARRCPTESITVFDEEGNCIAP